MRLRSTISVSGTWRGDIVNDKLNYYRRWPSRLYQIIPGTLKVTAAQGRPQLYDVSFEYMFKVSNGQGTRAGRGVTTANPGPRQGQQVCYPRGERRRAGALLGEQSTVDAQTQQFETCRGA